MTYDHSAAAERLFDLMSRPANPIPRAEPVRPQPDMITPATWQTMLGMMHPMYTETLPDSPVLDADPDPGVLQPQT